MDREDVHVELGVEPREPLLGVMGKVEVELGDFAGLNI
jgi:hypothetical protein